MVVVVGGRFGPFGPGDRPVVAFVGRLERKLSFLGGGLGGVEIRLGGGGLGQWWWTPPPPLLPLTHPASTHAPPDLLIPPPRVPHRLHPSPLRGLEVARRHPYAAHRARSLPIVETSQESKAQGWVSGHDAVVEGPQGYFLGSFGVSPGHPDGLGIRHVDHDVKNLKKKKRKSKLFFSVTFLIFRL